MWHRGSSAWVEHSSVLFVTLTAQELEAIISKRTGKKDVLPELTDIPNEKIFQSEVKKAFIEEGENTLGCNCSLFVTCLDSR